MPPKLKYAKFGNGPFLQKTTDGLLKTDPMLSANRLITYC